MTRLIHLLPAAAAFALLLSACGSESGSPAGNTNAGSPAIPVSEPAPEDNGGVGLDERAALANLALPLEGEQFGSYQLVNAYPNLRFLEALFVDDVPGDDRLVVVEQAGRVKVFDNDALVTDAQQILDITSRVAFTGEQGLLGLAFDPRFTENRYVYISYTRATDNASVISRLIWDIATDQLDTSQEKVILQVAQPFQNHNGGMIAFGPDNYLYIALGDGGNGGDPQNHGQNLGTLLASILRIDVHPQDATLAYDIPDSNPFVGVGGAREEIYAYGLRNPWRFSFDRATGDLWLGDVGQEGHEEINRITAGANYGWRVYEGNEENNPFPSRQPDSAYTFPVHSYAHDVGRSVIGGYVYRGAVQSLNGRYIYSDFTNGIVSALSLDGSQANGVENIGVVDGPTSFGETADGEMLVVSRYQGLFKLMEATASNAFPERLSQTGLFSDLSSLAPVNGLIEYTPSHPFWSDGTVKRRWFGVPDNATISVADNDWVFPLGSVIVKHFEIERVQNTPSSARRLETRVMYHTQQGWQSFSYRWNSDETDATLLRSGQSEQLAVQLNDGSTRQQQYDYPSPADCRACHTEASEFVLGLETRQLNSSFTYPAGDANQLRTFNHIGLFDSDIGEPADYQVLPALTDNSASIEARARAYLDVNCSSCHQPSGSAPTGLDLRYEVSDATMNAIGAAPELGSFGIENARVIAPGNRQASVLWFRMSTLGGGRMPPLSTHVVDEAALDLVGDWIDAM